MREITVPSSAVVLRSDQQLTPAMVAAVWEIANALDKSRTPANVPNAIWLEIPTATLRGEGSRADNIWLRECLNRLTGMKLAGSHQGDQWGAVLLAEWHIIQHGSVARLLVPPAGVNALRAPQTFTKIEAQAAHRLTGHARRLYAILADKKRLGRPYWVFTLDELKSLLSVENQRSYDRFSNFRARVLDPALEAINDFGTVTVAMHVEKLGRAANAIRFEWKWKAPIDAATTVSENEKHSLSRRKEQEASDAPPMIETLDPPLRASSWWGGLSAAEKDYWSNEVGRTADLGLGPQSRPERVIAEEAFKAYLLIKS